MERSTWPATDGVSQPVRAGPGPQGAGGTQSPASARRGPRLRTVHIPGPSTSEQLSRAQWDVLTVATAETRRIL